MNIKPAMIKITPLIVFILFTVRISFTQDAPKKSPVNINELLPSESRKYLVLSSTWIFHLNPDNMGEKEEWYQPGYIFNDEIIMVS